MTRISFRAWRGQHHIGPSELLSALGPVTAELMWELSIEDVSPGSEVLESLAEGPRVGTRELIVAAFPYGHIIDGTLRGFASSGGAGPLLTVYAVDSSDWDVESSDASVLAVVRESYPEVVDAE